MILKALYQKAKKIKAQLLGLTQTVRLKKVTSLVSVADVQTARD